MPLLTPTLTKRVRKPPPMPTPRLTAADWRDFERVGRLLHVHDWVFAKTMAHNPHHYTLRKHWVDAEFIWVVGQIRLRGYRQRFGKSYYTQLDVNDHFYWTMGWPIGTLDRPGSSTILINKKPLALNADYIVPYDAIADRYDALFRDAASLRENDRVFEIVGDLTGRDVLDVGCGTGLAFEYANSRARSYLGLDPSQRMLDRFLSRFPSAQAAPSTLRAFVGLNGGPPQYDTVLALFGVGSYLTDEELLRIPTLLRPGGRAAVMFYPIGYVPQTYIETGVTVAHRSWTPSLFPGEVHRIGHHVLCLYESDEPGIEP